MDTMWKDFEVLFQQQLNSLYSPEEIKAIFLIIIEDLAGLRAVQYTLEKSNSAGPHQVQLYSILQELQTGKPIQHILGKADFYGNKFEVNAHTLIPRPETEELVHHIIQNYKNSSNLKIIDIGTGTGCIPITLSQHLSESEIWAIDISAEAIEVAKRNNSSMQQNIQFILADILEWEYIFDRPIGFDIIVSNPPYITSVEMEQMHPNVLNYEPHTALFVEDSAPLLFYDYITDFALYHLKTEGTLYFEINQYLGQQTAELIQKKGFDKVTLLKDINGAYRIIKAQKK